MVRLVPLLESDLVSYLEVAIPNYATENVKAGYWSEEEALGKARDAISNLLPEGVGSKSQYLYKIEDAESGQSIGVIWLNVRVNALLPSGFIYDIEISEEFRGKGYGKQAMLAVEEKARELGLKSISLQVFAHNSVAKGLYEKIGYEIKSMHMTKVID